MSNWESGGLSVLALAGALLLGGADTARADDDDGWRKDDRGPSYGIRRGDGDDGRGRDDDGRRDDDDRASDDNDDDRRDDGGRERRGDMGSWPDLVIVDGRATPKIRIVAPVRL